jgi:hypothetical protein
MKHIRRVFSNVRFDHGILTKLIFGGHGMGTFVKDGIIFHRCLITYVDLDSSNMSCRWLGMIPNDNHIQDFKGDYSFNLQSTEWKEETILHPFYLSHRYRLYLPFSIRAEDELIIGRTGNPYVPELCPLR